MTHVGQGTELGFILGGGQSLKPKKKIYENKN